MSALFSRVLAPHQCLLLQLPASARQSQYAALQAPLLARQAILPSLRLFHASPIAAIRKPSKSIVKPTNTAAAQQSPSRQRPSSTPKKAQSPFYAHQPAAAPPHGPPSETATLAYPAAAAAPANQNPTHTPAASTPATKPAAAPSRKPSTPAPAPFGSKPSAYKAFIEKLATRDAPTVIYTAQSQTLFVSVCIGAALFANYVSYITWKNYEPGVVDGNVLLAVAAFVNCSIWALIGGYFAWGSVGLIRRIVAVPATAAARQLPSPKPTLRFEPCGIRGWPKPFEVPMGNVYSDRTFSLELAKIERYVGAKRAAPGVIDEYFGWIGRVWEANVKMFARPQRFAYVRVNDKANFKVDLRNCETLDDGRALDQLIKFDAKPVLMVKRMFQPDRD